MANIRQTALEHKPKQMKNIADLEAVSLEMVVEERKAKNDEGKEFTYKVAILLGEEYRIPESVLSDIKILMENKPTLKTVKVIKKGTGMNTKYTTMPLE